MNIMTRIYALIDPRSDKPFYVGRTSMLLRQRLDNHVRDGKNNAKLLCRECGARFLIKD